MKKKETEKAMNETPSTKENPLSNLYKELHTDTGRHTVYIAETKSDSFALLLAGVNCIELQPDQNAPAQVYDMLNANPTHKTVIVVPSQETGREWFQMIRKARETTTAEIKTIPNKERNALQILAGDPTDNRLTDALKTITVYAEREEELANPRPGNVLEYLNGKKYAADLERFKQGTNVRTGFPELDKKIGGGLYAGLYVIGAPSSIGKTTFVLQLADQIAEQRRHVIFFSMEQSRLELVTKSISRISRKMNPSNQANLKTSLQIRKGYTSTETEQALQYYRDKIAPYMNIIEGNFDTTADTIRATASKYIRQNKERPVIIIDYLQIVRPNQEGKKKEMRLQVDDTMTAFKRLSRDLDTPVILISSVNRGSYYKPMGMDSFKESGGVEFTADVAIGLEQAIVYKFDKETESEREEILDAEKKKPCIEMTIKGMKNRYGVSKFKIKYLYTQAYDYFLEEYQPAPKETKTIRVI